MTTAWAAGRVPVDLLKSLFDREPAGVGMVTARDSVLCYANPAFEQFAGSDVLGRTLGDAVPSVFTALKTLSQRGVSPDFSRSDLHRGMWRICLDGQGVVSLKTVPVGANLHGIILFNERALSRIGEAEMEGTVHRLLVAMELVGRSSVECSVNCQQKFGAVALDGVSDAVVVFDDHERVLLWNAAAARMFGCHVDEMLGRPMSEAFNGLWDSEPDRRAALSELEAAGRWRGESTVAVWDGRRIPAELTVSMLRDEDGGRTFVAVIRDIGDRRERERRRAREFKELETEWQRLRAVMNSLPVVLAMTDRDGRLLEMKPGLTPVLNLEWPTGTRAPTGATVRWADTGALLRDGEWTHQRALADGEAVHGDILDIESRDGVKGTVVASAVPIPDEHGNVSGAVLVVEDITEQRRQIEYGEALSRASNLLHSSLAVEDALSEVLAIAASTLGVQVAIIALRGSDGWRITSAASVSEAHLRRRSERIPLADRAVAARDVVEGPLSMPYPMNTDLENAVRALAVPLVVRGEAIGAMLLGPKPCQALDDQCRGFVRQLAASISFSIANASLYEEQVETAALRALLNDIDAEVGSFTATSSIFDAVLPRATSAMKADLGLAAVRDGLGWHVSWSSAEQACARGGPLPERLSEYAAKVVEGREPIFIDGEPVEDSTDDAEGLFACSLAIAPLFHGDEVSSMLVFARRNCETPWSPGQVDFVRRLGAHLSLAAENAALLAVEQERAQAAEALASIDRIIHSSLEPEEVLQLALTEAAQTVEADGGSIAIRQPFGWVTRYVHGEDTDSVGMQYTDQSMPYVDKVRDGRQPLLVDVSAMSEHLVSEDPMLRRLSYLLVIPLFVRDEHVGLMFLNRTEMEPFTGAHLEFGRQLGLSLSVALENARLYQDERHIAETLQETLLVLPKKVPGVEFARLYRSATVSTRVGGDFIDVFPLAGDRVVFALGDVSGKGIEAAAVTASVRNTIRAYSMDGFSPAHVAEKTNAVLSAFTEPDVFVSAVIGMIHTPTGRMVYTSAGHPPAVVLSANGRMEPLGCQSPVLGALPETSFRQGEFLLRQDQCLIAYSDGVIEARGAGDLYGEPRLMELLGTLTGGTPKEIVGEVFSAVEVFSAGELRDDVALLAIRLA